MSDRFYKKCIGIENIYFFIAKGNKKGHLRRDDLTILLWINSFNVTF
ncbi:hypothetical protein C8N37_11328 [Sphingobacterium faecium]|nr:hypothetical protein C8N37_11328 [Sphingobacterium faecium]